MTPDERQLISGLFDRMRDNGAVEKDPEAESLINRSVRQLPDSAYLLVQSVLAQEHYLQEASARIQELEAQVQDLEGHVADLQQAQQAQPQRTSGGSFLGGLFGGSSSQPQQRGSGSVPSFSAPRRSPSPAPASASSPWGTQPAQRTTSGGFGQQSPMQQQPAAAQSSGPSFMRSALTTAAGVAGGMMAANAISGMLRGDSSANAAHNPTSSEPSADANSPFSVNNNDADRQREVNEQQDLAQDAELDQEQYASLEDDSDSGDWGSFDDSEY